MSWPKGFYVYAWYEGDEIFYIGSGSNNRATGKHVDGKNQPILAEIYRRWLGESFRWEFLEKDIEFRFQAKQKAAEFIKLHRPKCNL